MSSIDLADLVGGEREKAVPVLVDAFTGIYRWHAKRTLRRVSEVRGLREGGRLVGVSLLEQVAPVVGYVYYIAVSRPYRDRKFGGLLLDDALIRFRSRGSEVVYAATETTNVASIALFSSRGFREVERDEAGFMDGGLGAVGLRTKMTVVRGETLLGLRLAPATRPVADP